MEVNSLSLVEVNELALMDDSLGCLCNVQHKVLYFSQLVGLTPFFTSSFSSFISNCVLLLALQYRHRGAQCKTL